jgi:phosphate transport system permease protein
MASSVPNPAAPPLVPVTVRQYPLFNRLARLSSRIMFSLCVAFTLLILLVLVAVTGYLLSIGISSLHWSFFTKLPIPPGMAGAPGGMANALVGTGILIALGSAVGIPMGVLAGIYLSEYSSNSWLGTPTRFIADVLTGVPSIVVGILGYELLVAPLGGYNGYAGAAALAFIMIPIVARTTEEMLRLVPNSYREASIALGATKCRTILGVVLPAATGSVVTGIMLAIARVAGETAPLLFTALGARFMPLLFNARFPYMHPKLDDPFPSLTVQIFNYSTGPFPDQQRLAWAGIIVLIALIFCLNLAVRFCTRSIQTAQH